MRLIWVIAAAALAFPAAAADHVIDGDTLTVGRHKIRLCGIDAPERGEPGYKEATDYLRHLTEGKAVQCRPVGAGTPCDGRSRLNSRDRMVATCFVDGRDLAAELVRAGHAKDWPKFSGGYYSTEWKASPK
jgi:endonuclease YncB( thermonuclease family)